MLTIVGWNELKGKSVEKIEFLKSMCCMLIIQKVLKNIRQHLSKTVSTVVKTQKFVFLQCFQKNRFFVPYGQFTSFTQLLSTVLLREEFFEKVEHFLRYLCIGMSYDHNFVTVVKN